MLVIFYFIFILFPDFSSRMSHGLVDESLHSPSSHNQNPEGDVETTFSTLLRRDFEQYDNPPPVAEPAAFLDDDDSRVGVHVYFYCYALFIFATVNDRLWSSQIGA